MDVETWWSTRSTCQPKGLTLNSKSCRCIFFLVALLYLPDSLLRRGLFDGGQFSWRCIKEARMSCFEDRTRLHIHSLVPMLKVYPHPTQKSFYYNPPSSDNPLPHLHFYICWPVWLVQQESVVCEGLQCLFYWIGVHLLQRAAPGPHNTQNSPLLKLEPPGPPSTCFTTKAADTASILVSTPRNRNTCYSLCQIEHNPISDTCNINHWILSTHNQTNRPFFPGLRECRTHRSALFPCIHACHNQVRMRRL